MIYPQNMAAALRRFEPAATPPDDGESGGDLPDDEADCCAVEGTHQPEIPPTTDDAVTWRVAMLLRVRRLEAAANDANNRFQTYECRIAELERQIRRSRDEQAAALALEVRALDAAREVA